MDLLKDNIKKLYYKYLAASLGSNLIVSIYSVVDTVVIGRYEGPKGTASVAAFTPLWSIMLSLGLLFGIGGSVLMAHRNGAGEKKEGQKYYTVAMLLGFIFAAIIFFVFTFFMRELIYLFGGRGEVLELALKYGKWVAWASPLFLIGQLLIPFVRNDNHPETTTIIVVVGALCNIFGDIFFTFTLDMGISGAGLATALAQAIAMILAMFYLFSKKCNLHINFSNVRGEYFKKTGEIFKVGVSTFVVELSAGLLAMVINNRIIRYSNEDGLAVFGVISMTTLLIQTLGYAIGESGQAIMSVNFGAKKIGRILETRKIVSITAFILGGISCVLGIFFPEYLIRLYMEPTESVLAIGVIAIRIYFIELLVLLFNVTATYYFQSINLPKTSLVISLARGVIISSILAIVLPCIFGVTGIWIAAPLTEFIVMIYVLIQYKKTDKKLVSSAQDLTLS